ncbi:hypothetical protein OIDMADRAFT_111398 [Oidiodendron maius Zn]|uniref:AMP-dependent synthetase/ligase domain-containing protein n=1 Tax=Oidiodendron maius (strain Zn) TaxID=913774 RepID=A0A0C3DCC6_OIDMZ|nr:hypothetical protein OIDMADRAFT_111398 [Oidiodendron maius Zn]
MHVPSSELWGDALPDYFPTILQQFHNSVAKYPENTALVCTHQEPDLYGIASSKHNLDANDEDNAYLRWTFTHLKTGVDRLKAGLESLGVQRGTAIVTLLPNCAEFALTWWAAMELGAVMAPLDPRRLSNASEVSHMVKTIIEATNNAAPVIIAFRHEYLDAEDLQSAELPPLPELKDASILFTSGSTSLPKGVLRSHPLQAALTYRNFNGPGYDTLPGDLWCSVAPNSHSVGTSSLIAPMLLGAGIVYAGATFSAEKTAEALLHERCTHILLVPAMVNLIAEQIGHRTQALPKLKAVMLAASPPTRKNLQTCFEVLGARGVCIRYGSTEGVACITNITSDAGKLVGSGDQLSVGRPVPGAGVKICRPNGTGTVRPALPPGTPGEIHYCGPLSHPTIYIGQEDTEDVCYVDRDGHRWFVTGDEGVIDQSGRLFIVGRLKDMIIRGGENISPAAIEARLADNAALASTSIQVVGQPNPISGETPIAIIDGNSDVKAVAAEIHRTILSCMGPMWIPQEVIHLSQLGLDDWPRTSVGKIHKTTLRELLHERYCSWKDHEATNTVYNSNRLWDANRLRKELLGIWASAIGLDEDSLPLSTPISEFADSLTVARVRGQIKRGIPGLEMISAHDILDDDTLSGQIETIMGKLSGNKSLRSETEDRNDHPPTVAADMVHTVAQPNNLEPTRQIVTETISRHGFTWEDVAGVFPAHNFVDELSRNGVLNSAKFQNAYITKTETKPERVKRAFEAMLRENHILPSFLVWHHSGLDSDVALHVTLKPSEAVYEHVLQDGGSVDTVDELQELASAHPHPEWTLFPGILFRVLIYNVKSTGTVGFIISVSHGVMDATYLARFQSDLDQALDGAIPQALRPHVSYKLWAESYYSFRQSPQAVASVRWHTSYLNGLHDNLLKAQWPPVPERGPFDASGSRYGLGARYSFEAPYLATLRKQYPQISVPIIVKAALALFNVYQTGHDHAIFSNVQAGRTAWPFMPESFSNDSKWGLFDEATDVAGPLLQSVTNLVKVLRDESVIDMLHRLQADQQGLTQHAHAPWPDIEKALNKANESTALSRDHRGLIRKIFTTQIFNWIPGMGAQVAGLREPFANFKILKSVTRWQVGLIIRAGVGGVKSDKIFLHLFGDGLEDAQMDDMARK